MSCINDPEATSLVVIVIVLDFDSLSTKLSTVGPPVYVTVNVDAQHVYMVAIPSVTRTRFFSSLTFHSVSQTALGFVVNHAVPNLVSP